MSDNEIYIQRKIKLFKYLSEFIQKPISIFETVEIAKMIKNKYYSPSKVLLTEPGKDLPNTVYGVENKDYFPSDNFALFCSMVKHQRNYSYFKDD